MLNCALSAVWTNPAQHAQKMRGAVGADGGRLPKGNLTRLPWGYSLSFFTALLPVLLCGAVCALGNMDAAALTWPSLQILSLLIPGSSAEFMTSWISALLQPSTQKSMLFKQHNQTPSAFTFPYPRSEHNWVIALAFSSSITPTFRIWHLYKGTIHLRYGAVRLSSWVVTQYLGHTHTKQLFIVYLTSQI